MERVADLTGADFSTNGTTPTVTFPTAPRAAAPAAATTTPAARTLARETLTAPARISASAPAPPQLDLDDVYDHVAARLRRELLHDRERIGDLVGDLQPAGPPR